MLILPPDTVSDALPEKSFAARAVTPSALNAASSISSP